MGHHTGSALYIALNGTDVSENYRSLKIEDSTDVEEVTAGSQQEKEYIPTLSDGTGSIMYVDDGGGNGPRAILYSGWQGTLEWGPQGTATGNPKYSCVIIITGDPINIEYNTPLMKEYSFQKSGNWIAHAERLDSTY